MRVKEPELIVALDVDSVEKAKHFVDLLHSKVKIFKVGLQLFIACGPEIIDYIHKNGAEVFLDLKFYDIPNTVANAVKSAVSLKVKMLTLHISGGEDMLAAAVRVVSEKSKTERPLLIGVTVLTSQNAEPREVVRLADIGIRCGLDGVVCSVHEVKNLRDSIKKEFLIITPGIRPKDVKADDQKRVATYKDAEAAGSDFVVVGRPVLEAENPLEAIDKMLR